MSRVNNGRKSTQLPHTASKMSPLSGAAISMKVLNEVINTCSPYASAP